MPFSLTEFRVDGKVALVTGAGARRNSIGRAYAWGLAAAGAEVIVADLDEAGAHSVAAEITAQGCKTLAVGVDIADPASVAAMARFVRERCGGVDILVNNAAVMAEQLLKPAMEYPIDQWNHIFAVNLTGALNCAQALVPMMRERGGGKIINQISGGAYPAKGVYGITKLALVGLTTTLAAELGRANINVNAIAPGNTMSEAGQSMTGPETPFRQLLDKIVTMRVQGEPDELVGALLLLCSPAGSWIHGQVIHVDGGWVLRP
jgi:NAD(P)-dependent dehydrogenase (short-subunit alcohol dehydrogenase family)